LKGQDAVLHRSLDRDSDHLDVASLTYDSHMRHINLLFFIKNYAI
jgi:hypothetical protein